MDVYPVDDRADMCDRVKENFDCSGSTFCVVGFRLADRGRGDLGEDQSAGFADEGDEGGEELPEENDDGEGRVYANFRFHG